MQERFITMVKMVSEQKEQVKFKCWAGWASEDKMRDELHMKESFDRNYRTINFLDSSVLL